MQKSSDRLPVIALAGSPNVGKSTLFNALTGMKQHTGNWTGKTVSTAAGQYQSSTFSCTLTDLPGAYSLCPQSAEEEAARDFLCSGKADAVIIVCSAAALEQTLRLALQIREFTGRAAVCVNLMDEAEKAGIRLDLSKVEKELGIPVTGVCARKKEGLETLMQAAESVLSRDDAPLQIRYLPAIENALSLLEPVLKPRLNGALPSRWTALRLLEGDAANLPIIDAVRKDPAVKTALFKAERYLEEQGLSGETLKDRITSCLVLRAEEICCEAVKNPGCPRSRNADRLLTGKWTAFPLMLLLLALVLWLTIAGANVPSQLLGTLLFRMEAWLRAGMMRLSAPEWLTGALVDGGFHVLALVVSVMLPPMAIFFPLFTLLEDLGVLPRIAFNLDHCFQKACACGKQSLTMLMGLGCNAVGVTGARIIDSPRERLLAILTNAFVPCNGRFPTLLLLISVFFTGRLNGAPLKTALLLTGVIVLGIWMTFLVSRILSRTLLRGIPSAFTLELPPYRRPQAGKILIRSILDRTLSVLGRAAAVAAPAGIMIWAMTKISIGGVSLLAHCAGFLDPAARLFGMDGAILLAFLLGSPANEIVFPIILMIYTAAGSLPEIGGLPEIRSLLLLNGWTGITAACTMLFSLMHWPCSTTLLTIRKETGSLKWTALAAVIPTIAGLLVCFLTAQIGRFFL